MEKNIHIEFSKKKNFFNPQKKKIDFFLKNLEERIKKYYNNSFNDKIK